MNRIVKILKALADPNRLKIIRLLYEDKICVCELVHLLGLPQPTVSHHLKNLTNADLITVKKQGLWMIYQLIDFQKKEPKTQQLLKAIFGQLDQTKEMKVLLKKFQKLDREKFYKTAACPTLKVKNK